MSRNKVGLPYERPTRYVGPGTDLIPIIKVSRAPTSSDARFPLGQFWLIGDSPTTGSVGELYYLCDFVAGVPQWCLLRANAIDSITGSGGTPILPDANGNVTLDAAIVATGTNSDAIYVDDSVANTLTIQLQAGSARTGAPSDSADAGVVSFDDTAFNVDANGYVTLLGGAGPAIDSVDVDFNTAPGTDPVLPTGAGLLSIYGNAVTNGTNANAPVATHSRAANQFHVEVQLAADITGAPADPYDAGICSFNDTQFVVDGNGYVSLVGTTDKAPVQTITGDGGTPIEPSSGNITLDASTVANATNAKPLYIDDSVANTLTAEVQVATAIASAPGDKNDAGLASFDSADFSVDSDGFVTLNSSSNILSTMQHYDDFLWSDAIGSDRASNLYWNTSVIRPNVAADLEAGHPGIWALDGISNRDIGLSGTGTVPGCIVPGGGEITLHWVFKPNALSDATNGYRLRIGFSDATQAFPPSDGLWFEYTHGTNSGNWQIVNRAASTSTTNNTSTAAVADWTKATIVINAAGTSVAYYIDGVEVSNSPITTNIPGSISPWASIQNLAGSGTILKLDLMYVEQALTTAR